MKKLTMIFSLFVALPIIAIAAPTKVDDVAQDKGVYTSPGKPQHPLHVDIDWNVDAKAGESLPVNVKLSSGFELHDISVTVSTSNGLLLDGPSERFFQKPGVDGSEQFGLKVLPSMEGVHEIHVKITAWHGESLWQREITKRIPVGVKDVQSVRKLTAADVTVAEDGISERRVKARQEITRGD